MSGFRFEIQRGPDQKYYVRFRTQSGDSLHCSGGFEDATAAEHFVTQLQVYGPGAPVIDYSRRGYAH